MTALPTGTVTFLFTDLEGSTRLWEEHPDAMQDALARHDLILRGGVAGHAGHVVKSTGDGIHAVFATAHDALGAAVVMQRRLATERFGETGPLRVRMGLHTCEADYRDSDFYGTEVNRAARLMSVAHGGQIVVSLATSTLVRDGPVELIDLGEHRLADLTSTERIFQVAAEGLAREFPPLRSLNTLPGNLPRQLTTFIGRGVAVASVADLVRSSSVVTLTGVGGVGKTRLALQAAAEVLPEFADGAWLCELGPVTDPAAVVETIASALGVQQRQGRTLEQSVLDMLRAKELLLLLDNCEHVLDAVATTVQAIVSTCPRVRVLATSREGIALAGERIVAIPSLGVPSTTVGSDLAACESVQLFVARAAEARPGFELTKENGASIGEICRRLDGIPLAIELASARVAAMTPTEIASRLDQRFRLLTGSSRAAIERHQTLRRMIDWSYDLLADDEQRVFERLAVFAGGGDLAAVERVAAAGELDRFDVLDVVLGLVRRSLVVADERDGATRYRLLETIRQYAEERLEERSDATFVRRRHAEHYVALVEEAGPHLRGHDQLVWSARIEPDVENLRAALGWCVDNNDTDLALRLIAPLTLYGNVGENVALSWAEIAITARGTESHPLYPRVAAWAARAALFGGDLERSAELSHQAFAAQDALGLAPCPLLHWAPALLAWYSGRVDDAVAHTQRWVDLARESGDRYETATALMIHGVMLHELTALKPGTSSDAGITELEQAASLASEIGNPGILPYPSMLLAQLLLEVDLERAAPVIDTAVQACTAADNHYALATALSVSAGLHFRRREFEAALHTLVDAVALRAELGDVMNLPATLLTVSSLFGETGRTEAGAVLRGAAEALRSDDEHLYRITPEFAGSTELSQWTHRTLSAMRTELGEPRFLELTRLGASMDATEAAQYARAQADTTRGLDN
jgi:predicted ATPase/class 3 adenylate cyclase